MNLLIPKSVKQFSIERKYYKKYFYKIVLEVDLNKVKHGNQAVPRMYYNPWGFSITYAARQELLKEIAALPIQDAECKIRSETRWVSVFTNDTTFIEMLFDKLVHRIIEYHRPVSDEHKAVIDQSRRIRVRKRLFENQFKYKVYFRQDWKIRADKYSDIKLWVDTLENTHKNRWAVNKTLQQYFDDLQGYKGYTAAVYLNDPEDLMMCQMRFLNEIDYIEEAVLIDTL